MAEVPIPRLPPVTPNPPPPRVSRVGQKQRRPGDQPFSLGQHDPEQSSETPQETSNPTPEDDAPVAPPAPDEAGSHIDFKA